MSINVFRRKDRSLLKLRHLVCAKESGFTLVEVLVAMSIFSVVGLVTFSLMQRAMNARVASKDVTEQMTQIRQALSRITSDLANVQIFSLRPFRGYQDSLRFVVISKSNDGIHSLQDVAYFLVPAPDDGFQYLMRLTRDFYGKEELTALLSKVKSFNLEYLEQQINGARWIEDWSNPEGLPLAVRVQIRLINGNEPLQVICPIRTYEKIKEK